MASEKTIDRAAIRAASEIKPVPNAKSHPDVIVLDTETTGLVAGRDHLLTVGVCDRDRLARRHEQHKRYYAKTAFKYKPREWTVVEDKMVLAHAIPDSELSEIIRRSMKAISNRRWRLTRKLAKFNSHYSVTGNRE